MKRPINPTTKTDWLLSVSGLSFFGWLLFGLRGLLVGPSYLLLTLLIRALVAKQKSAALRRRIDEEKTWTKADVQQTILRSRRP